MAPSELHKLSYWEEVYQGEKENYEEAKIQPEEWFEENCDKIINWVSNHFSEEEKKEQVSILDVGCGNGLFLHKLRQRGFGNLCGFDFSASAIDLAKKLFQDDGTDNLTNRAGHSSDVYVQVLDIYNIAKEIGENSKLKKKYKLINDKGTFDIFFMNEKAQEYFTHVSFFFQVDTLFCLTSCNACKEELLSIVNHFNETNGKIRLTLFDEIRYETITFGGVKGQIITTLIFSCS
ncbi:Protein-lysine N-methyltransferase PKH_071390 [Plasmodium coatneyi]|uniref:Protein-lysine N-methyltransferase PCOAH_00017510 n=1 Tax=Plasmodium coatneyi TaxID=208452 RepID=A0A1B1DXV6_9APIC|nr:Protein-lysine N-methyltransferase PKH_071390 [Plasmodium coatneyi]ANQ07584.1 Protein-lysine N-methyltransferase PKH_071390 [Plasmodium coatneyi]